jgi:sialate O-acetylesterase
MRLPRLALLASLFFTPFASAELKLGTPFSNHMMVQMDRPIPVWGTDEPGMTVVVAFNDELTKAVADENGDWRVELPATDEIGPHTLTVHTPIESIRLKNVIAGDIFLCSGQSNMGWRVRQTNNGDEAIANADNDQIRLLRIPRQTQDEPVETIDVAWEVADGKSVGRFSAVGYYFGRKVHRETGRPVGLIDCSWGGSKIHAWLPREVLQQYDSYEATRQDMAERTEIFHTNLKAWKDAGEEGPRPTSNGGGPQHQMAGLYNAMTHPLGRMPIKGVLWYQGESDTSRPGPYQVMSRDLVQVWRDRFLDPSLPVYFVQLPNFMSSPDLWRRFREAQRALSDDEHVEMVVTIDVGDTRDIHPRNKLPVGERLARFALRDLYGMDVLAEFPIPTTIERVDATTLRLTYDHVGDGLTLSGGSRPLGFVVVDADGSPSPAEATIEGDNVILLRTADADDAAKVWYAFEADPDVNLVNSENLPAVPFEMSID